MARKKDDNNNELIKELNINKKELVDEIKNEIKKNLDSEIKKTIDYETNNKLDKMEKRIYREKRWKIIRKDILIIILLGVICYETYLLYSKGFLFKINNEDKTNKSVEINEKVNKEIEEEKRLSWYIENYSYLLDNINTNLDESNKYYLYESSIKASEIENSIKLNIAYQLLDKVKSNDGIIKVKSEDLKESFNKIFNEEYKEENFNNDCLNFIYNQDLKTYIAIDMECDSIEEELIREIKNIYEEDDRIIIETKVGIKKDNNLVKFDKSIVDNIDNLDTYKFVFKNDNGKYYFYKIVKV